MEQSQSISKDDDAKVRQWQSIQTMLRESCLGIAIAGLWQPMIDFMGMSLYFNVLKKVLIIKVTFLVLFCAFFMRLPSFDRFTGIKFVLYCISYESLGFGCNSAWLGGLFPQLFPHFWNVTTGFNSVKISLFYKNISCFRDTGHFAMIYGYFGTIIFCFLFVDDNNINESYLIPMIGLFLLYFLVFDRTLFLSARPEYYGYYLLCLYFDDGWLTGCRILQIMVWFWAAFSKFGVWFDYPYPIMLASNGWAAKFSFVQKFKPKLYRDYNNNDLRPSFIAVVFSRFGIFLEIGSAIFVIFESTRIYGLITSFLLHSFIFLNFAPGAVNEWNVSNLVASYSLFYATCNSSDMSDINDWYNNIISMNLMLKLALIWGLLCVPFFGNVISPDKVSFLLSYRYYAGNWEHNFLIVKKSVWNSLILAGINPQCHNKIDTMFNDKLKTNLGWRLCSSLNGKAIEPILHKLLFKYNLIDCNNSNDEYYYIDVGFVFNQVVGWSFADAQNSKENFLYAIKQCIEKNSPESLKKYENEVKLQDLLLVHVNGVRVFGKEIEWFVYDKNGNQIVNDTVDAYKDVHHRAHFTF